MDSNPDSDHLSHVDCDPDSNPDSGPGARVNAAIDPIDYVTGIGNAHSNQYKIFAHSALWCWSSSPRSELENSVSWTAEVRLS